MMLMVCLGTWAGLGFMTGASARFGTGMLGVALAAYAISGLVALRLSAPGKWEPILSPVVGGITGLITAATGVFVIPAVPYLQAMGLEKEELVQALGLSFTIGGTKWGTDETGLLDRPTFQRMRGQAPRKHRSPTKAEALLQ
jgi:uncharacterized membrane protein YfcA